MKELLDQIATGTNLTILFTYFSITASFLLIFPILLGYHSQVIDYIDKYIERWASFLISESKKIIREKKTPKNRSATRKNLNHINSLTEEFERARKLVKPKQTINFFFGFFSVSLFFIILFKIYYYSYNKFPITDFTQETDFTESGFFLLCWIASIIFSIFIFLIRLYPLIMKEGFSYFGLKRFFLVLFGICLTAIFWKSHFFYFAYPTIAYFVSTILLATLLLIESLWFYFHLKETRPTKIVTYVTDTIRQKIDNRKIE